MSAAATQTLAQAAHASSNTLHDVTALLRGVITTLNEQTPDQDDSIRLLHLGMRQIDIVQEALGEHI